MSICIVDNGGANLCSIQFAFNRIGASAVISNAVSSLRSCSHIVLPGVGHAKHSMEQMHRHGIVDALRATKKPVLGICLGLQLLYEDSAEGATQCLGLLTGTVDKMAGSQQHPAPHMGWNRVYSEKAHPLLDGIASGTHFYFVHSFFAKPLEQTVAVCDYQEPLTAIAARDNFFGTQFHPEKSGTAGAKLLKNFLELH